VDRKPWEKVPRLYKGIPRIAANLFHRDFSGQAQNAYQVTSEGTQLQFGQIRYRLELFIPGEGAGRHDIDRYYNFDWVDSKDAPDRQSVYAAEATMRKDWKTVAAPLTIRPSGRPY